MNALLKTFALFAALSPVPALASEVVLQQPLAGATLQEQNTDMALYFTEADENGYEVVGIYADRSAPADARRITMRLDDGDAVRFALPGHEETLYTFERRGTEVQVSAETATAASSLVN